MSVKSNLIALVNSFPDWYLFNAVIDGGCFGRVLNKKNTNKNAITPKTASTINRTGIESAIASTTGGTNNPNAPPIGFATLPRVVAKALCLSGNQIAATLAFFLNYKVWIFLKFENVKNNIFKLTGEFWMNGCPHAHIACPIQTK